MAGVVSGNVYLAKGEDGSSKFASISPSLRNNQGLIEFPSDFKTGVIGLDGVSGFSESPTYRTTSPYNADLSKHENYFQYILSKIDGYQNTEKLVGLSIASD